MLGVARAAGGYKRAYQVHIAADAANVNLRTIANAQGYVGGPCDITLNAGVEVYGSSTGVLAIVPGSWPAGMTITFINKGFGSGCGGDGGPGNNGSGLGGGHVLDARAVSGFIFRVDNGAGVLRAGGGGGGGSESLQYNETDGQGNFYTFIGGGGGGGGGQGRVGGIGGVGAASSDNNPPPGGTGGNGGPGGPGGGGANGGGSGLQGYPGANGGGYGAAGQNGFANEGPIPGGSPGYAVLGNANIVWLATGTRLGLIA